MSSVIQRLPMARKPETIFRNRIKPQLESLPRTAVFPIDQSSICGDPDLLLCVRGLFVAIELKVDDTPSKLQIYKLNKVLGAYGISIVATPETWEEIYLFLQKLAKGELKNDSSHLQKLSRRISARF